MNTDGLLVRPLAHLFSFPLSNMVGLVGMECGYGVGRFSAAEAASFELDSQYRLLGSKSGRLVE